MNRNPIIVALDVQDHSEARRLVRTLGDSISFYKVGLELYAGAGMPIVKELIAEDKQVFLDLKLYDIAETVKRATAVIAQTGARFLTVHATPTVMRAAREAREGSSLELLAVTVLTSWDSDDVADDGYGCSLADLVARRVRNAQQARMDGLICSARDVAAIRKTVGPAMPLVTPGVRSPGADAGDQKRIASPAEAIAAGADYVVIGREITRAPDPRAAVVRILGDLRPQPVDS